MSLLIYDGVMTYRDLAYVPLSSSGQMTITNHGTEPVDIEVVTRGYFMTPPATPVGAEYAPVGPGGPVTVYGTGSAGAQIAANGSVTFQVAGAAGLPATGVVEVAEHVVVTDPADSGFLDVYRGGGNDPDNATTNFVADDNTDVGYQDSILSTISPTGQETITNHSSGTVNVLVAVVGMFFSPQVPAVPSYLQTGSTDSTSPVLTGVVQDATGDDLTGEIFLFDSSGNPIGGSPTATGDSPTGEDITWTVPSGVLTDGDTYQWYMEACDQGVCSAPSTTQVFTVDTADAPPLPTATASVTLTGSAITATDAITDAGACSGSDCPTTANTMLNAGYDGTNNWASGLAVNVSSIPAGSTIVTATLQLTESGCLTGSGCASTPVNVYQPTSDVTSIATGPELVSGAIPGGVTATAPASEGTWDITGFVQGWVAGDTNDGLIIQAAAPGDEGITYYSPTANVAVSELPQVTIGYIPPSAPSAPNGLSVTPGDGGVLVTWADPADWGYADATGNATADFTVDAETGSTIVATTTTDSESAVLTGLTDGTSYTITVAATNPVGTGPAASTTSTPVAVTGGPAQYGSAVSQFLNAQDELISGQAATATGALAGDSMSAADLTQLANENLADSPVATAMAAEGEQDTADTTALSSTLAMPSPGGAVTVYATADETFTTVDTSAGSPVDIPGAITTDYLFTFTATAGTPQLTGYVDADSALGQPGDGGTDTAYSSALDGPAPAGAPAPLATDSFGNLVSGADSTSAPCISNSGGGENADGSYYCSDRSAEVTWALNHTVPKTRKFYNGFLKNDCTDFASRSLAFGGGLKEDTATIPAAPFYKHNDKYWYQFHRGYTATSSSWAGAYHLANFFFGQGSFFLRHANNAKPGYIIFAQLNDGGHQSANFGRIDHTGVITKVNGKGIYITQHSPSYQDISLYREKGHLSWFAASPHLYMWIVVPSRKT